MIRLLIADDEELVREALAALLGLEPDIEVVAQAANGKDAVALARTNVLDLAILDIEMPVSDGITAAREMRTELDLPIVLVTRHTRPGILKRALVEGVRGFVPKTTPAAKLVTILRDVHGGARYVDPEIAASALTATSCPLTARELDVLATARGGGTVSAVADAMHLAPGTVRNYLSSAMQKLDVATRHDAARRAWEEGWI